MIVFASGCGGSDQEPSGVSANVVNSAQIHDFGNGVLLIKLGGYDNKHEIAQAISNYERANPGWVIRSELAITCGDGYTCAIILNYDRK